MVSRRDALRLAGTSLLGCVAGCAGGSDATGTSSPTDERTPTDASTTTRSRTPTDSPTDEPTATDEPSATEESTATEDPSEWDPAWTITIPESHALGLDAFDGAIYAALSDERGPSAVAEVDPTDGTVRWRTEFEGEAEAGTDAGYRPIARDQWGVTVTGGSVYSVHGRADARDWTALHALDRSTGERRWSLRRERSLAVHGVVDGLVVATGREFFEPETTHDTPEEPLVSELYAVDADTGEVRWKRSFAGVADVTVDDRAAYVATEAGFEAVGFDGDPRWSFETDRPARTVRASRGRVYSLTDGDPPTVYGLNRAGDREWTRELAVREVLLDGDRLYAGGDEVVALDPDGSVAWRDRTSGGWLLLGPAKETLYTRHGGGAARGYGLPSGAALWSFVPEEKYGWPLAATAEAAVVEGYAPDRVLYAVDRRSGTARQVYDGGERSLFTAASVDGRVFVGTGESRILALDP